MREFLFLPAVLWLGLTACSQGGDNTTQGANDTANVEAPDDGSPAPLNGAGTGPLQVADASTLKGGDCPIVSSAFKAAIVTIKGQRMLAAGGNVEVGSSGYKVDFEEGALDKSIPPIQHFKLTVTPPSGPIIFPIPGLPKPSHTVAKVIPAQPKYQAVTIDCGGKEIARITDIPEIPEVETGPAPVPPVEENKP